jgi:hypothetical protein
MCHPNAANTHPETYPKYQVQMQKVALLRDMINWCIEHPTKGKPLADDDPRLRAMEAYIMMQRKWKGNGAGKTLILMRHPIGAGRIRRATPVRAASFNGPCCSPDLSSRWVRPR